MEEIYRYSGRPRLGWILTRGQDPLLDVDVYPAWAALTWRDPQTYPPWAGLEFWDRHAHAPGGRMGQRYGLTIEVDRGEPQHRAL